MGQSKIIQKISTKLDQSNGKSYYYIILRRHLATPYWKYWKYIKNSFLLVEIHPPIYNISLYNYSSIPFFNTLHSLDENIQPLILVHSTKSLTQCQYYWFFPLCYFVNVFCASINQLIFHPIIISRKIFCVLVPYHFILPNWYVVA